MNRNRAEKCENIIWQGKSTLVKVTWQAWQEWSRQPHVTATSSATELHIDRVPSTKTHLAFVSHEKAISLIDYSVSDLMPLSLTHCIERTSWTTQRKILDKIPLIIFTAAMDNFDFDAKIDLCETIIGHTFSDRTRAREALTRWGALPMNDRLAVHGDAALKVNLTRKFIATTLTTGEAPRRGTWAELTPTRPVDHHFTSHCLQ